MPMPFTYQSATRDFEAYLDDLRTISGLAMAAFLARPDVRHLLDATAPAVSAIRA